jgi:hypothetical protein
LVLGDDAVKALKDEALTEVHIEELNAKISAIFRQIILLLNDMRQDFSIKEIQNVDVFSKELAGMFDQFNNSFSRLVMTMQSEIQKHEEIVKRLDNAEDALLNKAISELGIVLQDEISTEDAIIKSAAKTLGS